MLFFHSHRFMGLAICFCNDFPSSRGEMRRSGYKERKREGREGRARALWKWSGRTQWVQFGEVGVAAAKRAWQVGLPSSLLEVPGPPTRVTASFGCTNHLLLETDRKNPSPRHVNLHQDRLKPLESSDNSSATLRKSAWEKNTGISNISPMNINDRVDKSKKSNYGGG